MCVLNEAVAWNVPSQRAKHLLQCVSQALPGLGGYVEVGQVLLAVEGDVAALHPDDGTRHQSCTTHAMRARDALSSLTVTFVANQDHRHVLSYTPDVPVEVWGMLVRHAGRAVEHQKRAVEVDSASRDVHTNTRCKISNAAALGLP